MRFNLVTRRRAISSLRKFYKKHDCKIDIVRFNYAETGIVFEIEKAGVKQARVMVGAVIYPKPDMIYLKDFAGNSSMIRKFAKDAFLKDIADLADEIKLAFEDDEVWVATEKHANKLYKTAKEIQ